MVEHPAIGPMLRLSRDREGRHLLPTLDEEAAKAREESARAREESANARAANERFEAEVAALRAKLGSAAEKPRKRAAGKKKP